MTQTAAHRLVTEAAAAATYRTAAQVTTEATAQATAAAAPKLNAATYTAEKGAANGIATLGSDGKVTPAQLPAATSTARGVVVAATVAAATSLAAAAGEGTALRLTATLDPNRIYEYEAVGIYNSGGGTFSFSARALAGSTAPTTSTGTGIAQAAQVPTSQYVPPLRARFTVGTAGTYTVSLFSGGSFQTAGGAPGIATLSDVGAKVTGLPAVP